MSARNLGMVWTIPSNLLENYLIEKSMLLIVAGNYEIVAGKLTTDGWRMYKSDIYRSLATNSIHIASVV